MNKYEIYFLHDNELAEHEAISKGYRNDVYIKINDQWFRLSVYDNIRLQQDFEEEIETNGYYSIEVNLVLVKETSKREIQKIIENLYNEGYFKKLKPLESLELSIDALSRVM